MKSAQLAYLLSFSAVLIPWLGFSANLMPEYTREKKKEIYAAHPDQPPETFLSDQARSDLHFDLLFQALDRAELAAGSVEFQRLLLPTSDMEKLNGRHQILMELLQNEELFSRLEQIINQFKNKYESIFISLLDKNVLPDKSALQQCLNGLLLSVSCVWAANSARRHVAQDRALMREAGRFGWFDLAGSIYIEAVNGLGLAYFAYENLATAYTTVYEVDEFVLQFANAFVALERINQIVLSSSVLAKSFPAFSDFKAYGETNKDLGQILEKLESRANAQETAWAYWHMKDSISLYDEIRASKNNFAVVLWWAARIDAYMSVIRWIKEKKAKGESATFVKFRDGKRPSCQLSNLTNPTIPNSVENSFDINGHVVLTGPHALGKTSSMRSIAYAYIMAQSILAVPAGDNALLVPVFDIKTYFNVGDSNGESSFQAEFRRMGELLYAAQKAQDSTLLVIDEPFAKTPSLVGEILTNQFLERVVDQPCVSFLLSTHLETPSHFADTRPDVIQNLQPEVRRNGNGFGTTYKIVPGAANWWLNNKDDQTNKYIRWLISQQENAEDLWFN
jgi:DNA mismatch repair ATPase MutS